MACLEFETIIYVTFEGLSWLFGDSGRDGRVRLRESRGEEERGVKWEGKGTRVYIHPGSSYMHAWG